MAEKPLPSEVSSDAETLPLPLPPPPPKDGRPPFSLGREVLFTSTLLTCQILAQAGMGQGLAVLHMIGDHFHVTDNGELSWYLAAFSLTTGTFILVAGRLGDMYGSKPILIGGLAIYALWSFVAGASYFLRSSDKLFVIARALQGLGASLMLPNAVAILGRTYPMGKRKSMVFSLFGAFAPGGYMLGALFTAIPAQFGIWAWAYFAMGFACLLLAAAAVFTLPPTPSKASPDVGGLDWPGFVLGVSGLILLNVAWNQGPTVGWATPYVYVLLILGVLALGAFVVVEKRATRPLVPIRALNWHIVFVLGAIFLGWSSFSIWLYYLWQFLEKLRDVSPLLATAQNSPSAVSGFVASVATGLMIHKVGVPVIMVLAMVAFLVANVLVATMPVHQTYWTQTFFSAIIVPWGMDMSFPAAMMMLSAAVPREHQGIAASLLLTTNNYAMSIGLGIAGTVLRYTTDETDLFAMCRHAWYVGVGLSALGVVVSVGSLFYERRHPTLKH
ncbi:MFS transporter [Aspergillus aculeatinus CBS 121060]|uniref:Aminotriazole resistance protein n=1 Tax=Aspergillus aculeatinus CBS 121060 TaxID=1448322 RepID=A0ACD1H781_9EURO|nr:putative aminotriazole resistance protein [Aspergillus aculeatinus CBS 121060]RAH69479.1 putative aminotriazole resistance protein [Aspergillus aculeatinus CBS 121060]